MEEIIYNGEHLIPGQIGHFFILLALVTSGLSIFSYIKNQLGGDDQWKLLGRFSYGIHSLSVIVSMGIIIYMMVNHYYEYAYVQAHVNDELPLEYVLSAFWEGQEGSFLLWLFWNGVFGTYALFRKDEWESGVGIVLNLCQIIILSMILGVHVGIGESYVKIGSSPFVLLRDTMDAPIFANENYLQLIEGQGLNELLQDYWNVIHPPVTFAGFSTMIFPFAYGVASLFMKDYTGWLKPARNWALFGGAVLGMGILMGSAWAYEALTFGGYWAWDPVENMILVPWLVLIAGLHTNVVAIATKHSIKSTYVLYFISFLLLLYSTFLVRSGALGDTSVHAFTEMGLETQLIGFMGIFTLLSFGFYFYHIRSIPNPEKEESLYSREFLMFIGALVILVSSALITYGTSLPIINDLVQIFDPSFRDMVINDPIPHYNKHQLWIAVMMGLLTGCAQFFRYREFKWQPHKRKVLMQIAVSAGISAGITLLLSLWIEANAWQYLLLMFTGTYAVVGNLYYFFGFVRDKTKVAGSVLSHVGFGVLIIGVLASGLNKEIISNNFFAQQGLANMDDEIIKKNIVLIKEKPMLMNGYNVTYQSDTLNRQNRTFKVNFEKLDSSLENVESEFTAYPNLVYNKEFNDVAAVNPSIKRGIAQDIFTHITNLPSTMINPRSMKDLDDSLKYEKYSAYISEQIFTKSAAITVRDIKNSTNNPNYEKKDGDYIISPELEITTPDNDSVYYAQPALVLRGPMVYSVPVELRELNMRIRLVDSMVQGLVEPEESLNYEELKMKQGETVTIDTLQLTLGGISNNFDHPTYTPRENDIAFSAQLNIESLSSEYSSSLSPIYFIRDSRSRGIRDIDIASGFNIRLVKVDPDTEEFTFEYAFNRNKASKKVQLEIAEEVPITDYIVLQAIIFPGINLVWLGSLFMIFGMAISLWNRKQEKKNVL